VSSVDSCFVSYRSYLSLFFGAFAFLYSIAVILRVVFMLRSFVATQVFASHALWHMCVLGAVYTSFHFYIQYQALLRSHGCAAYQGLTDDISMVSAVTTCVGEMINGTCAAAY
jgi:hypothetical protein